MSNFQLQDITLFNDSSDLLLKGSWVCFQTQMQKSLIHRVLPFHVETVVMLSHKKTDSVINVKVEFGEGEGKVPLDNIIKRAEAYKPKEQMNYSKAEAIWSYPTLERKYQVFISST